MHLFLTLSLGYECRQLRQNHPEWQLTQAVPPQRGESNDLGVWTLLSSRSALTPDLEPFLILFLRCPSFWHYLLSLVFKLHLFCPHSEMQGLTHAYAAMVRWVPPPNYMFCSLHVQTGVAQDLAEVESWALNRQCCFS